MRRHSGDTTRTALVGVLFSFFFFGIQATADGAATSKSQPTPKPKPSARLIVQRAANFGGNRVVQVWIDGKKVANVPRDQHYGATISAGRHTLAVLSLPNTEARRATSIRLSAKAGKVYIYTAAWNRDRLVLQPSTTYTPTQAVKPITEKKKPETKRTGFWPFRGRDRR